MYKDFPIPTRFDCTTLTHELHVINFLERGKCIELMCKDNNRVTTFVRLLSTLHHNLILEHLTPEEVLQAGYSLDCSTWMLNIVQDCVGIHFGHLEWSLSMHVNSQPCDNVYPLLYCK